MLGYTAASFSLVFRWEREVNIHLLTPRKKADTESEPFLRIFFRGSFNSVQMKPSATSQL